MKHPLPWDQTNTAVVMNVGTWTCIIELYDLYTLSLPVAIIACKWSLFIMKPACEPTSYWA